ncbi:efflux RND transporter periplasmic adaptor subunit [Pelomonas sp. APW6]|uniref:Efflux RND transporter periplasmic adaptor subunit n=1 Tax=Roseateles subflavus TaxID=3053353 RepID=A0ABT7LIZ9_9BURK|nr:efflux RND transporter periplasmic adaptor subunit [Pelomonas sp. APW6]MDL5032793.1 efflux RND transporter periplasmic adaptor subunit [Pelomonas sp. APW6]
MSIRSLISRRPALLLALAGLVGAAPALAADKDKPAATAAKPALSVQLTTPQNGSWTRRTPAVGAVAPWAEQHVSAETGGLVIVEVRAQVGDVVKRGQLLARLQDLGVQADLAQARAALAEAEAAHELAQADAQRARQIEAEGGEGLSRQALQQYQAQARSAAARLQSAQARVKSEELRLSQTRIVASDDGVVSAKAAVEGAVAQPGQELFRLIRQQRLEWRAELPAELLAQLKPGARAQVQLPGRAEPLDARLRTIAPTVDPQTRMGIAYVDLPAGTGLRAGSFLQGSFEQGAGEALHVPQSAVQLREGFAYVFKVSTDGRVQQTKVSLGRRQGDRVEVLQGLEPAARIVAAGVGFLADGDRVQVVTAAPAAAASR